MKYKVFRCALTIISYNKMADKSSIDGLCILCRQLTTKCPQRNSLCRLMRAIIATSNEPYPNTPPSVRVDDLWPSEGEDGEDDGVDDGVDEVVTTDS